jgi:Fanconi anemia group M protein
MSITIIADNRERQSGIPDLLKPKVYNLSFTQLYAGDYIINESIIIERKTKTDFVQSIINGRLFEQCAKLRKTGMLPLFIVEGNPFGSNHNIKPESIKGALLSITLSWQIPVIRSSGKKDTAGLMIMAAQQQSGHHYFIRKTGIKPKAVQNQRHYFIRNLPGLGPKQATVLLKHFGTIENIVLANVSDLIEVEGIGKKKADRIYNFFR